jgi:hypothetical protein
MKLQAASKKELIHISIGVAAFSVVMNAVYLLLGKWSLPILWSTLLGGGYAVLNFFFIACSAQRALDSGDRAGVIMRRTYTLRMLGIVAVLILSFLLKPTFNMLATAIPLLFPRLTILVMQLLGFYKPEPFTKTKEASDDHGH